ncbi:MAG: hypothetical protein JWO60_1397 [Frankiales bacterium]|nr:hypothetical protein [Frankiales bacterium]
MLSNMETTPAHQDPRDPDSVLTGADEARRRLATHLRLPTGLYSALAGAVALQVGTAAYGVADHEARGLAVALAGLTAFLAVAASMLHRFRRINGVRVDALTSQVLLGEGPISTTAYLGSFGAALWAANGSHWWLVAAAAAGGGVGYAFGLSRWWHAYQHDPAAHAGGISPRVLAGLAALGLLGLVALLLAS